MFRLVVAMFGSAVILMLLFGLGQAIYQNPWDTFKVVGSIVGAVLAFATIGVCGMFLSEYLEKRKYQNKEVPDSLFMQKYKAHKSKICPMVEFKE
jgi:cation transporter-like permease